MCPRPLYPSDLAPCTLALPPVSKWLWQINILNQFRTSRHPELCNWRHSGNRTITASQSGQNNRISVFRAMGNILRGINGNSLTVMIFKIWIFTGQTCGGFFQWTRKYSSEAEHLPSMCKALGLIPNSTKLKIKMWRDYQMEYKLLKFGTNDTNDLHASMKTEDCTDPHCAILGHHSSICPTWRTVFP